MFEIHLKGKGYSGKAVRLRVLDRAQIDKIIEATAVEAGADASPSKYIRTEHRFGSQSMVVGITTKPVASIPCPEATWVPFIESEKQLTSKDWEIITKAYLQYHAVSNDEVESILGKALEVAED